MRHCIIKGRTNLVEQLLDFGCPAKFVSEAGNFQIMKLLIDSGARIPDRAIDHVFLFGLPYGRLVKALRYLLLRDASVFDVTRRRSIQAGCRFSLTLWRLMGEDYPVHLKMIVLEFLGGDNWIFEGVDVEKLLGNIFMNKRTIAQMQGKRKKMRCQ